jgi:hypothetical protein
MRTSQNETLQIYPVLASMYRGATLNNNNQKKTQTRNTIKRLNKETKEDKTTAKY